jgi:hypothetical protein
MIRLLLYEPAPKRILHRRSQILYEPFLSDGEDAALHNIHVKNAWQKLECATIWPIVESCSLLGCIYGMQIRCPMGERIEVEQNQNVKLGIGA